MGNEPPIHTETAATASFDGARGQSFTYSAKVKTNIGLLIQRLSKYYTKASVNTPEAEADIQKKFREFLIGCEFRISQYDFDDLLEESKQKPRDDGTAGWHHQLSQILMFLSKVEDGTIPLENLGQYGGLETAIRTILRHDSIEDFGTNFKTFKSFQKQRIQKDRDSLTPYNNSDEAHKVLQRQGENLNQLMNNLRLLTKKVAILDKEGKPQYYADGRMKKKSLFKTTMAYIQNMLHKKSANPVAWMIKTFDGTHNLSTMLGALKFTAVRRLKYCNEREDMYGGRNSLPEKAAKKWSKFSDVIRQSDNLMGAVLYINFGFLEYVDQKDAYPDDNTKHKKGDPIYESGVGKYIDGALSFNIPRAFNPLHILLDDIKNIAENSPDELKRKRAQLFLEKSIKPALAEHKSHFPRLFNPANDNAPRTAPAGAQSPTPSSNM